MATRVKNNLGAVRSLNTLNKNSRAAQKNLRKVATGEKITSAADDASAWGISERMREKIRSLDQANQNTQNDLAMMNTAEEAVANIVDILRTLKQKAIDSANDSNTDEDRRIMQKEVDQLIDQIDDNALVTFNGKFLVNGQMSGLTKNLMSVWVCNGLEAPPHGYSSEHYMLTKITDLKDRDGASLQIQSSDKMMFTWTLDGKTMSTITTVGNDSDSTLHFKIMRCGNHEVYRYTGTPGDPYALTARWAAFNTVDADPGTGFPGGYVLWHDNNFDFSSHNAGCVPLTFINNPYAYAITDREGKVLRVPNPEDHPFVVAAFNEISLSSFKITVMDEGGHINEHATNALRFELLQRGESSSSSDGGGLASTAATFHVGAGANQSITVGLSDMRASALGLKSKDGANTISILTRDDALVAIDVFDGAIKGALDQLTSIGAVEARLEYTIGNIDTSTENVQASESTIRDADMAREMTAYTRDNILTQAAQAMLAQANQDASSILGLLS